MSAQLTKVPKEFRSLVAEALSTPGMQFDQGSRHLCLRRADGHKQMIPGTPSDHRALSNFRCQLRRFVAGGENFRRHA